MEGVRKYRISYEYKAVNRPWRVSSDWVYAKTAKAALKQFKKGSPHIWPEKFRKIKAKRM